MPTAPLRPCSVPRCPEFAGPQGRCLQHAVQDEHQRHNFDLRRRYRTARWRMLRAIVLREQVMCCAECKRCTMDLEVHHIIKPGMDDALFWLRTNLQALCKPCHSARTARGE